MAALAVTLAACSNAAPSSPLPNPGAVLAGVPAAATHAGAVHFVEVTSSPGLRSTLTGELSAKNTGDADEHLVQGNSELDLERVGFLLYLRGSSQVLQTALGFSATEAAPYVGKWISVSPGDFVFQPLSATLDLGAEVRAFVPKGQIHLGSKQTLRHTVVVPFTGDPSRSTAQGATGKLTLFVATNGLHLPAGATLTLGKGSRNESRVVAFTRWGQPIHLTAPAGAVSYRDIATAPAG
jgi:hypothetical protein